jgi:hypothetical protein
MRRLPSRSELAYRGQSPILSIDLQFKPGTLFPMTVEVTAAQLVLEVAQAMMIHSLWS